MMNINIKWIIALMGVVVILLIVFQILSLKTLVESNNERFNRDVIRALNNVARKLEKKELKAFFHQLRKIKRKKKSSVRMIGQTHSHDRLPSDSLNDFISEELLFVLDFTIEELNQGLKYVHEVRFKFKDEHNYLINDHKILSILRQKDKKIESLEKQLNKINNQYRYIFDAFRDFMMPSKTFSTRIDPHLLDSLLKEELKISGIEKKYSYGIIAPRFDEFIFVSDKVHTQELMKSELKSTLFPNDIFYNNHGNIVLYFPKDAFFLIKNLWTSLLISILLLLFVLFCFWYSIRTIINQKKISEIKNDFINNMTHELKTPISTVSLVVEALNDKDIQSRHLLNKYLTIISDENKRLENQVEKVLQIAMLDRREFKMKEERVDMVALVEDSVESMRMKIERFDGNLVLSQEDEQVYVTGDSTHLQNTVINILDNSIKYSTEKVVHITVRSETDSHFFTFSVEDVGIGMSKEQQQHIFEKFYRAPKGNIHNVKGFGLGLAYVQSVVNAHRGSVTVRSEQDKGSKFIVKLPLDNK